MIISLGEALIDFVSQGNIEFKGFPGGSPYNTAIAISRLGIPCSFLGRISTDLFGEKLIDYLKNNSINTNLSIRTRENTTLSFVEKQHDGQAVYAFFASKTADRNWKKEDLGSIQIPEEAKIIHFGSISISLEPVGETLTDYLIENRSKLLLSFDPNIRPSLIESRQDYLKRYEQLSRISSIVKLSDEDLKWIYPNLNNNEAIDEILKLGVSLIALTTGEKGAFLINKNNRILVPILKSQIVDTIGAGDTFHGALLSYIYNKKWFTNRDLENLSIRELEQLGSFANKAAGINCMRSGANPPTLEEMEINQYWLD